MTSVILASIVALALIAIVSALMAWHFSKMNIPVPRRSERTLEERVQAEVEELRQLEASHRALEFERTRIAAERSRLESEVRRLRRHSEVRRPSESLLGVSQAVSDLSRSFQESFHLNAPEVRVTTTHITERYEKVPQIQSEPKVNKPVEKPKRKSRYERDPVI